MTKIPNEPEVEARLLGGALGCIDWANQVVSKLRIEYFYNPQNAQIFSLMKSLVASDQIINLEKIFDLGSNKGVSAEHVMNLQALSSRAVSFDDLLESIKTSYFKRSIQALGKDLFETIADSKSSDDEVIRMIDKKIYDIHKTSYAEKTIYNLKEVLTDPDAVEFYEELKNLRDRGKEVFKGIPTGFKDLDEKINSFQKGHLTVIGGRPGAGKTMFALNLVEKMAINKNVPCIFFSLEMKAVELGHRLLFQCCELSGFQASKGIITKEELQKIEGVHKVLLKKSSKLIIEQSPTLSIEQLRTRAMRYKRSHDIQVILIDYLQLVTSSKKHPSRHLEVAEVSVALKTLAKELDVPVIALAQINRESTKRTEKRPNMADLRESGQIEADADEIILLHYDEADPHILELNIEKNRSGPRGRVSLYYKPQSGNLYDCTKRYEKLNDAPEREYRPNPL